MAKISAFLFLLFIPAFSSLAQTPQTARFLPECDDDKKTFCGEVKNDRESAFCLMKQDQKLSNICKSAIERMIQTRKQAAVRGGGALSSFAGLNSFGPSIPIVAYEGRMSPGQSPRFTDQKLSLSSPVYKNERDTVTLNLSGGAFHFGDHPVLSNGRTLSEDWYRFEFGAQYSHSLPDKKTWGLRSSIGYAGDRPFQNGSDLTYSLNANYGLPGSGNGYWVLALFFSNNNSFLNNIPIPGVIYFYRTETFTGLFGFPILSMQWTPITPWSFSLSVFGPTVQAEAAYGSLTDVQIFTGFYYTRQRYIPVERADTDDRLTIREAKVGLGLRTPLLGTLLAEIQAGRAFARSIFIGHGLSGETGGQQMIDPDWYLSLGIKAAL